MTPHHTHRLTRLLAVAVVAGAVAAPAAAARPAVDQRLPVSDEPGTTIVAPAEPAPAPAPVVQSIDGGIDWASIAIGAGGTGALVLVISLGGMAYMSRGHHVRATP